MTKVLGLTRRSLTPTRKLNATGEKDKGYENMACEVVTRLEFT